jgi:hypothetical protein
MAISIGASAQNALDVVRSGNLHVPPPADSVAAWPLIGQSVHAMWQQAATDLTGLTQQYAPQIRAIGVAALGKLAGFGAGGDGAAGEFPPAPASPRAGGTAGPPATR